MAENKTSRSFANFPSDCFPMGPKQQLVREACGIAIYSMENKGSEGKFADSWSRESEGYACVYPCICNVTLLVANVY